MNTTNRRRAQFSILAVAALAIFAVAAVMLLSGGGPAQADTAALSLAPDSGGGPSPQQTDPTPRHATPEPCPGDEGNPNEQAARVVDSGHYALFDVWWNPEEKELTNNSCPPTVMHVPAQTPVPAGPNNPHGKPGTPARDDRSPSSINIGETVIHIPNSARVTLNETDYPEDKYPELWAADDAENPDGEGDRVVWALPACPPEGSPPADDLCISFSAALLNPLDWRDPDTGYPDNAKVEFQIDHVHQIDIDKQDPRYVLAYAVPDADAPVPNAPLWNTADADINLMPVAVGEYERPIWFFTSPGRFEFQVHIKGHPNLDPHRPDGLEPVSEEPSVTGGVHTYTFYVGPLTLNDNPVFGIERSVPENSTAGVAVGAPVPIFQRDAEDDHAFNLTGKGARKFAASRVGDGVQVTVAPGATLNYEDTASFDLNLTVSDGKDRFSKADPSVDDAIPLRILVEDDPDERLAVTLEANHATRTVGQSVRLTARVHNSPLPSQQLSYRFHEQDVGGGNSLTELTQHIARTVTWNGPPVAREYTMTVWAAGEGNNGPQVTSNKVVVVWTN